MTNIVVVEQVGSETITQVLTDEPTQTVIVEVNHGPKGDKGESGAAGAFIEMAIPTNGPISSHKAITVGGDGFCAYAGSDLPALAGFIGVTREARTDLLPVSVVVRGELVDTSFAFVAGLPIFVGINGELTQSPPVAGVLWRVGVAVTATRILIAPAGPVTL